MNTLQSRHVYLHLFSMMLVVSIALLDALWGAPAIIAGVIFAIPVLALGLLGVWSASPLLWIGLTVTMIANKRALLVCRHSRLRDVLATARSESNLAKNLEGYPIPGNMTQARDQTTIAIHQCGSIDRARNC